MRKVFIVASVAIVLLSLDARAIGVVTLSQDFDSGCLNVAASTALDDAIHLVGRCTWTPGVYQNRWRWLHFKASGIENLRPLFDISQPHFLGDLSDHRFLYSYDQLEWHYFDQNYTSGTKRYFRNSEPFLHDEVYVAYSLPYPLARTHEHTAAVAASPLVHSTASDNGGLVVGRSSGGVDDLGRTIAPNDLYGYKIADVDAPGKKAKILLSGGNHPCETPGSHALEGMIDFLLSDAPEAVGLRRLAEFYVYPQINPDGRIAGYYRSTPENPSKDYNRYWDNPAGFTDMMAVRDAMILDTGGQVDYLFDFHGMFGAWSRSPYYETAPHDVNSAFALALAELEPSIVQSVSAGTPGMLRVWGQSAAGLGATHAFTPEFGCQPGMFEDRLDEMGANYARALYLALVLEPATTSYLLLTAVYVVLGATRRRRVQAGRALRVSLPKTPVRRGNHEHSTWEGAATSSSTYRVETGRSRGVLRRLTRLFGWHGCRFPLE